MSATLIKSKTGLIVTKALLLGSQLSKRFEPIIKDLTSPALMESMDPNAAKAVNTCINIYAATLAIDSNEHVFVQYCAIAALLAPAHSPLKVLCTTGFSTGWLLADSKIKAISKRIALSGGLALAFSTKLSLGK